MRSVITKISGLGLLFFALSAACAPASTLRKVSPDLLKGKPKSLRADYKRLYEGSENDIGLNRMRLALKAYRLGYKETAAEEFDKVLLGIESIYAGDEKAQKARSLWYEEGMKDFKGEPYERVMAYFYRGLLYIEAKDLENARACFKAGVLQDSFAEEKLYRADFALMVFMEGWCSLLLNDDGLAQDAFAELRKLRPDFQIPDKNDRTLLIVETGTSPRKLSDGVGHYELKFRRGRHFKEEKVSVEFDGGGQVNLYPMEDIAWQAMTRGGRPIDKILEGQAVFRKNTEKVGTFLTDASTVVMHTAPIFDNSKISMAGAAVGLVGAASLFISTQVKARADTRYWDNLPNGVFIYLPGLSAGKHTAVLTYLDKNGRAISNLSQRFSFSVPGGEVLVYRRSPSGKL